MVVISQKRERSLPNSIVLNQYMGIRILFAMLTDIVQYAPRQIRKAAIPDTFLCFVTSPGEGVLFAPIAVVSTTAPHEATYAMLPLCLYLNAGASFFSKYSIPLLNWPDK